MIALLGASAPPALAAARVPRGFIGIMLDGPVFSRHVSLDRQMGAMARDGVESVRVVFSWSNAQPYENWQQVPQREISEFTDGPSDIPTDFRFSDGVVRAAALHGMSVLPVPVYAPEWDVLPGGSHAQPKRVGPYADYLTALVERYGPNGTFWEANPRLPYLPIRSWQVWNEPDMDYFWTQFPFAPSYVALLRAAHAAIKQADPRAKVILAGLANRSWTALASIYRVRGAGKLFDAAAAHPYTAQARGVIKILGYVRRVMNRHGDAHKPLLVTEFGWPSSLGRSPATFGIATTEKGQASRLAAVIPLLARDRRRLGLSGVDLYTWMGLEGPDEPTFDYSGLLAFDPSRNAVRRKPALAVFRRAALALEGCREKSSVATRCQKAG